MEISVIVCTFNRSNLLRGNLAALAKQKVRSSVQWEVVVVDNNCTDDTARVVAQASETFGATVRRVQEANQGLSNARNCGIATALGDYLFFTDDDTRPQPDWVQRTWETFKKYNCDCVAGQVELDWPSVRPGWLIDDLLSSLAHVDYGSDEKILASHATPPLGANMAFTKNVFAQIGTFDPNLGRTGSKLLGHEETDLFGRFLQAGLVAVYQPKAIVLHAIDKERLRKSYFRRLYYYGGLVDGQQYRNPNARLLVGVPLFAFTQLFRSWATVMRGFLRDGIHASFRKELLFWWRVGFLSGSSRENHYITRFTS